MLSAGALGALELTSIGLGIEAADAVLKRAAVDMVLSRPLCPGKYFLCFTGTVEDVRNALEAGLERGGDAVADSLYLTNPHTALFPALMQTTETEGIEALGIVETFSMCSALEAADRAAKRARVSLVEIRMSIMLAGKSYVTFTGTLSAVRDAAEEAAAAARERGALVSVVVIPHPHPDLRGFVG